jgi:hypothetical protein
MAHSIPKRVDSVLQAYGSLAGLMLKAMLRDTRTDLYFEFENQWTSQKEKAHDFKLGSYAIEYAINRHFKNSEVIVFAEPDLVAIVSIDESVFPSSTRIDCNQGLSEPRLTCGE